MFFFIKIYFIRKFVEEIIVFKVEEDRHHIKLDIYLNLFEDELAKTKGARHINGATVNDVLYIANKE